VIEIASETRGERKRVIGLGPFPPTGPTHPKAADGTVGSRNNQLLSKLMDGEGPIEGTGSPHVVQCVEMDRVAGLHHHVRAVETAPAEARSGRRWSLVDAVAAYRQGERFVLEPVGGDGLQELVPAICPGCRLVTMSLEGGPPLADTSICA
jgi:hypothetical protein